MGKVVLTKAMQGSKPFRCYNCHRVLALDVQGECKLVLQCPRCKARITLEVPAPIPDALAIRAGTLIHH